MSASTTASEPPTHIIQAAVKAGRKSPCCKSKRGAVVFFGDTLISTGYNSQPGSFICQGSKTCRENCAKLCVHAETRALKNALAFMAREKLSGFDMLHIKIEGGEGVAGGPPSCWQCSRELIDSGLNGMWLWEITERGPKWKYYPISEFHRLTLDNCDITYLRIR
jgi:deoxycytidylate deaminase